jgi:hypothetical protein
MMSQQHSNVGLGGGFLCMEVFLSRMSYVRAAFTSARTILRFSREVSNIPLSNPTK